MPRLIYSKTRAFQDNFITEISEDKIILQQEQGSRTWYYNQFQSWYESPYFFHLYTGPNAFFIIPKDVMSLEQMQEVRGYLKNGVK